MSLFRRTERRALTWDDVYGAVGGSSGVNFAGRTELALTVIPVYAAVALIADQFSILPLSCYRGGTDSSSKIPTPGFLSKPDPRLSVLSWRYQLAASLKLRGNAYGIVTGSPRPSHIVWQHPDKVRVDESEAIPRFYFDGRAEPEFLYQHGGRVLHIPEFVQPGSIKGLSPIAHFRSTYETAAAATGFGLDWFNNAANPSGLLQSKSKLNAGGAAEAKKLFMDSARGGAPVVLDGEWSWESLSIAPDEAQFLATIKATATQIAAIFRVAPEDIGGESGSSRSYSNRESDQELFNVRTLLPLTTRVELALSELLPQPQFVKFNMDVLNRPNLIDRSRAYTENLKNGSQTLPEVRKLENRPELTADEIQFWQENYITQKSIAESVSEAVSTSITKES